jgi:hypothetical protein
MILKLIGKKIYKDLFGMVQNGDPQSLAEVPKVAHEKLLKEMNEDIPLHETRGA